FSRDAQRRAVRLLVGFARAQLIGPPYNEPESRRPDRRQLAAAILTCQAQDACLVIPALGHLAASPLVLSQLATAGIRFVACDRADVNHVTIQARAAAAHRKEKTRTERIRAAWATKKATGYKPRRLTLEMSKKGGQTMRMQAKEFAAEIVPYVERARHSGCRTLVEIAERLNVWGIKTRRGCAWNFKLLHQFRRKAEGPQCTPRRS